MEDTIITNEEVWTGPSTVAENGWRKDARWRYHNGGQWGDDAIAGFTSYYSKPGTKWRAEISYYVEATRTENQPEVRDAFVVECMTDVYERESDDSEPYGEEITYDYGDVRYYDTFEAAFERAQHLAAGNESYVFNV
jgi:hypothetical protein